MTTETITAIHCNAKGCRAEVTVEGDEEAAWRQADAAGWSYDTGHDWCPWHSDPDRRRVQEPQPEETPA